MQQIVVCAVISNKPIKVESAKLVGYWWLVIKISGWLEVSTKLSLRCCVSFNQLFFHLIEYVGSQRAATGGGKGIEY